MEFLTLNVNQPEEVRAVLGRKGSAFGYGYSYHVVDFCKIESSVDNVINELQSHSMTHWCYIEGSNDE